MAWHTCNTIKKRDAACVQEQAHRTSGTHHFPQKNTKHCLNEIKPAICCNPQCSTPLPLCCTKLAAGSGFRNASTHSNFPCPSAIIFVCLGADATPGKQVSICICHQQGCHCILTAWLQTIRVLQFVCITDRSAFTLVAIITDNKTSVSMK